MKISSSRNSVENLFCFGGLAALALAIGCMSAAGQTTVFDENFDGGYTGSFSTNFFQGGSPANASAAVLTSGGNPNGCFQVQMTTTTSSDYFAGQAQLDTVSGNTDPNPANYVISFDACGSSASQFQVLVQTWQNQHFGGSETINSAVNDQFSAANTWQTFTTNLGSITTSNATGVTWQFSFRMNASSWGGSGKTDTLKIDNIILTHLASGNLVLSSSLNPAPGSESINFTAMVQSNGATAGDATGQVVFSAASGPFSTNTVSGGTATSASIAYLPVGTNGITAVYSGGNYPAGTNTLNQVITAPTNAGVAQPNLQLYTDNLVNGFENKSSAAVNYGCSNPIPASGPYCISVSDGGSQALIIERDEFDTTPYTNLTFWINGGVGGQRAQVHGYLDGSSQSASYTISSMPTNTWQQVTIPLSTLGVGEKANCTGFSIQGSTGTAQATFYVDGVQLTGATPGVAHLGVNASQVVGTVDARQFGVNTAEWDGYLGNSQTLPMLQQMGCMALRWPGGSTSDGYHWATDSAHNATFRQLATNLGAQVFTTVNYGTGTASEAAGWVLCANMTNHCGFTYWEVGNECYGSWETDSHPIEHDPYTYATNAVAYIQAMKAAYPAVPIKVGVVVVPGEDSYANNENHAAVNPRTHETHYGWTPVVLSQMNSLGVLPDFLIYHFYPQYTPSGWAYYNASAESDPMLLQVAGDSRGGTDWGSAASDLRQQVEDYLGGPGTNIELCVTENNCDSSSMGRQSTSVVDALYLADSACQLMKTEFRSYVWWDLRNGADTSGDFDPTLYGWRTSGDYGMLAGANTAHPTFYAEKMLQWFGRPGDAVLNGTSDYALLSAYAVHRTNGTLSFLVINKHLTASVTGQIALTNFAPWATATVRSYGLAQDNATETNGSAALQDIATNIFSAAGTNFSYVFPPLSLTLFSFAPGAPTLSVAQGTQAGQAQIALQGQPGTPYVIQGSPDLVNWTQVSMATLATNASSTNISISTGPQQEFYRVQWHP